ncbi:hypothetical protein [Niabella soli]|uniref:Uncharacterized protein n=1 Tax=Niabella soli DSM 19437 TaxID=929713 RepID=W0F8X3_9BACT|nr:hypothetical protein [Niabella soli]AHF17821.1 hypothetical protein NIASO_14765 [Niabella soli DSM 19437]
MALAKILLVLEWVSFITGLCALNKLGKEGRAIIYFLGVVVLSETVGILIRYYADPHYMVRYNKTWFSMMFPFQFSSLLLCYYKTTRFAYWRIAITGFGGILLFVFMLQLLTGNLTEVNTFNYTLGAIFVSACSLHYLFELMNSEKIEEVTRDPFLYISIGLLLFYLGTLPFHAMRMYLYETHREIFWVYYYLFFGFNYFLYGIITFAFLWAKKK